MIEKALKAKLDSVPGVSGTINVYPLIAPEGVLSPYIVYTRLGTDRVATLTEQGMHKASFQITIVDKSYGKMVELRAATRESLEFQTGVFTPGTPAVLNLIILDESEFFEPQTKEYTGVLDIQLIFN